MNTDKCPKPSEDGVKIYVPGSLSAKLPSTDENGKVKIYQIKR